CFPSTAASSPPPATSASRYRRRESIHGDGGGQGHVLPTDADGVVLLPFECVFGRSAHAGLRRRVRFGTVGGQRQTGLGGQLQSIQAQAQVSDQGVTEILVPALVQPHIVLGPESAELGRLRIQFAHQFRQTL